jgi:hypothetical protein
LLDCRSKMRFTFFISSSRKRQQSLYVFIIIIFHFLLLFSTFEISPETYSLSNFIILCVFYRHKLKNDLGMHASYVKSFQLVLTSVSYILLFKQKVHFFFVFIFYIGDFQITEKKKMRHTISIFLSC